MKLTINEWNTMLEALELATVAVSTEYQCTPGSDTEKRKKLYITMEKFGHLQEKIRRESLG